MEAPTFTTIERNQQAAMLALDWDHQVVKNLKIGFVHNLAKWDVLTVMLALDWDHQVVKCDVLTVMLAPDWDHQVVKCDVMMALGWDH